MLLATIAIVALFAALPALGPQTIGPMGVESSSDDHSGTLILVIGIAGIVVGLAWMVRILRSIDDVEAHESFFRFRR
jgi:hypothetical protein